MKATFPLAGGALDAGSTCGVVSGGCLGLALLRAEALSSDDAAEVERVYGELRSYARWFEARFGSTLCRERVGIDPSSLSGLDYVVVTGRMLSRCLAHTGRAVDYVVNAVGPARVAGAGGAAPGLCAGPMLDGIGEDTGRGYPLLGTASIALDGGIGLSGGLCGALAAALMVLGDGMGMDPREAGIVGTLKASAEGLSTQREDCERKDIFSLGTRLVHGFRDEFGSLECQAITGRSFEGLDDLRTHLEGSEKCARVIQWCLGQYNTLLR